MKTIDNKIIVRTVLPFIVTAVLFVTAMFFIIIPLLHKNRIERKKLAIKDLTNTAWESLNFYNSLSEKGLLTQEQAKDYAKAHIRSLRYGEDMKNYFWIIDMRGRVIVNPYSPHLEGLNQISLKDKQGKFFIKEFITTARDNQGGYVEYLWQWKDDPERIETKVSYIRRFHAWDWIVGTGVYLDDINRDMETFSGIMIFITLAILIIVSLLSFHLVKNFMASEKARSKKVYMAHKTESKIRMMIQSIPDMILRLDQNGLILDVKEPVNFKPFVDPGEMLGTTLSEVWPEDAVAKNMKALEKTFETSKPQDIVFSMEVGKRKNKLMKLEAQYVKCGKNEVLATFRDITKRSA